MIWLVRALVIGSLVWPLLLGAAVWQRVDPHGDRPWTTVVYLAGSRICHQLPDRSFHTAGVQWPVCARCSALYLSAPVGGLAAVLPVLRRRRSERRALVWLAVASVPTAATLAVQWLGLAEPSNIVRAVAALPLGALLAYVIVGTAAGDARSIG